MKRWLFVMVCSLAWIAPASAQVCGGGASFAKQPYQAGGTLFAASDSKIYALGGGVGGSMWWGQGGLELETVSGASGTAKGVFINLGGDVAVDSDKKLYVCPVFSFDHSGGFDVPNVDSSSNLVSFAGDVGYVAATVSNMHVIPSAELAIHHQSFSNSTTVGSTTFSADTSDNYGTLRLGVGFVFNDNFAVVPSVLIPFNLTGGENSFVLGVSYNFGK